MKKVDKKAWMKWAEAMPITEAEVARYVAMVERYEALDKLMKKEQAK